jgi:hypothetical protein
MPGKVRARCCCTKPQTGESSCRCGWRGGTLWLSQKQIAEVFGTKRPAITKHLANIFASGELDEPAVCSILEQTAADRKTYKSRYYNLDAILSVGYRVNSARATRFRQWASARLKEHLLSGYTLNEERLRLQQDNIRQLEHTLSLFQQNLIDQAGLGEARGLVRVIADYARTFVLLNQFDSERLPLTDFTSTIRNPGFKPVDFDWFKRQAVLNTICC